MMRSIYLLLIAMTMGIQPNPGHAKDRYACLTKCFDKNNARRMNCSSTGNTSKPNKRSDLCLNNSQTDYLDCFDHCPANPRPPSSAHKKTPSTLRM